MVERVLLTVFCLSLLTQCTLSVECTDSAWFSMVPVPTEIAQTLLPENFCLQSNHALSSIIPEGTHPLMFEFGKQDGCYQPGIPFFKTSFTEMKLEVPFVIDSKDKYGPNVYKPFIYSSTGFDAWSSWLTYGLPTYHADMEMTDSSYTVDYKGMKIEATFTTPAANEDSWGGVSDYPNFVNYQTAVATPWFCKNLFLGSTRCATNSYDWSSLKIRPATMSVKLTGAILGDKLSGMSFSSQTIEDSEYGTAQIVVPLSITFPDHCQTSDAVADQCSS